METPKEEPKFTQAEALRNQKIVVALFLILAKTLQKLPLNNRRVEVTEAEIKQAWKDQKSPVRILSERRFMPFAQDEGDNWNGEMRVYWTQLQELDLNRVGFMKPDQPFPAEGINAPLPARERGRVFDLE